MAKHKFPSYLTKTPQLLKAIYQEHNKLGLVNFMHDITFGQGQISMLVSNPETFHFFNDRQIPMICTDSSGRTLAEGIYINKTLEEIYKECAALLPLLPKVGFSFNQNYGKNSLHLVSKENDCQHLYSLFFDLNEAEFLQWVVNNGAFIQDLIADYQIRGQEIILEAKSPENRIVLPNSSDFDFSSKYLSSPDKPLKFTVIHNQLHIPIHLSNQQSRCFQLLMHGKSAKEIGVHLKLSNRTVEHYLEKIRKLLGCHSNKELVAQYYNQLNSAVI